MKNAFKVVATILCLAFGIILTRAGYRDNEIELSILGIILCFIGIIFIANEISRR